MGYGWRFWFKKGDIIYITKDIYKIKLKCGECVWCVCVGRVTGRVLGAGFGGEELGMGWVGAVGVGGGWWVRGWGRGG